MTQIRQTFMVNRFTMPLAQRLSRSPISEGILNVAGTLIKKAYHPYIIGGVRGYAKEELNVIGAKERHAMNMEAYSLLRRWDVATFNGTFGKKSHLLNLRGADLRGANLIGAKLDEEPSPNVDLLGTDLSVVNLRGADLRGANLSGAILLGADLSEADLTGAKLREAKLIRANLTKAKLIRADLAITYLFRVTLRSDLFGVNLKGAPRFEVKLRKADLSGANLTEADLSEANFEGATIDEYTDFTDAIVTGATGLPQGVIEKFGLKV